MRKGELERVYFVIRTDLDAPPIRSLMENHAHSDEETAKRAAEKFRETFGYETDVIGVRVE